MWYRPPIKYIKWYLQRLDVIVSKRRQGNLFAVAACAEKADLPRLAGILP